MRVFADNAPLLTALTSIARMQSQAVVGAPKLYENTPMKVYFTIRDWTHVRK